MNRNAILATLGPHMRRPIRAFLADPATEGAPEDAFWAAVYPDGSSVDHYEAMLIASKLMASPERVERVLEGWRP